MQRWEEEFEIMEQLDERVRRLKAMREKLRAGTLMPEGGEGAKTVHKAEGESRVEDEQWGGEVRVEVGVEDKGESAQTSVIDLSEEEGVSDSDDYEEEDPDEWLFGGSRR